MGGAATLPSGADLIAAERERQIEVLGWRPDHDDEHAHAELSAAAAEYLRTAHMAVRYGDAPSLDADPVPYGRGGRWPWHPDWWKPSQDPIRNLVKAGALIAAEIDRLQRAVCPECNGRKIVTDPWTGAEDRCPTCTSNGGGSQP